MTRHWLELANQRLEVTRTTLTLHSFTDLTIGVRGGGSGGAASPPVWKLSGETLFSGQALVAQNSWMIKNISIQLKIPVQLCFPGKVQVAQRSWMIKIHIQYSETFQGNSVFQGKRRSLKTSECKNYIHYSEQFQGNSVSSGKAQVAHEPWMTKNTYSIQWRIPGQLCFSGQAQVAQNIWM